jgi:DNA mismatch endonuclease (patch repair protein)
MPDPYVSWRMSLVRSRGSEIERLVRRALSKAGVRYRLHPKQVPGRPDLFVPRLRLAIFVNGCFWHRHDCNLGRRSPKSNRWFWEPKLRRNAERDAEVRGRLKGLRISWLDLWECESRRFEDVCAEVAIRYHRLGPMRPSRSEGPGRMM